MGIEGVSSRIADIQSRIIALQTQSATAATKAPAASPAASGTAFANHLSDAVAAQASPSAGAAAKTYKLNGKGVPTDLAAYGNGKIPANALEKVGDTGHKLWAPAAQSLTKMIADAKADGVTIGITDSYRSYAEQVDVYSRKPDLAAVPGTSNHGLGVAVDLCGGAERFGSPMYLWLKANAPSYGFVHPGWAEPGGSRPEPWHWEYVD